VCFFSHRFGNRQIGKLFTRIPIFIKATCNNRTCLVQFIQNKKPLSILFKTNLILLELRFRRILHYFLNPQLPYTRFIIYITFHVFFNQDKKFYIILHFLTTFNFKVILIFLENCRAFRELFKFKFKIILKKENL